MHVTISEGMQSVLIVEDEGLVALMMEDLVREMGAQDVLLCSDLVQAREIVETVAIDCAVLDVRVRGGTSGEIADILAARGIPFMFSTGSGLDSLVPRHRERPLLLKPFADDDFKLLLLDTWRAAARAAPAPSHAGPAPLRVAPLRPSD